MTTLAVTSKDSFELTDIQQAYWFGEQEILDLHTAAFFHRTYRAADVDMPRLAATMRNLRNKHAILRTCFHRDGTQTTLPPSEHAEVRVVDPQTTDSRSAWLASQLPTLDSGHPALCIVERCEDGHLIHFAMRLIAVDGRSLALFFAEMWNEYQGRPTSHAATAQYSDYVASKNSMRGGKNHRAAQDYWMQRIPTLCAAPQLPLCPDQRQVRKAQFERMEAILDKTEIQRLTIVARNCGVSLTAVLCTAYADVLRKWSASASFTINLLVTDRPSGNAGFESVLGNFSATIPLEIRENTEGFMSRAQALQLQMYKDMEHMAFSGIEITRAMKRPISEPPFMPVVFASTLGLIEDGQAERGCDWTIADESLHTPQVWLDFQVYMRSGKMVLSWDAAQGIFQPGVVEHMFSTYQGHLACIGEPSSDVGQALLPRLSNRLLHARENANQTARPLPNKLLHESFLDACLRHPDHTAIIAPDKRLTYQELRALAFQVASHLRGAGVAPGRLVAICAPKGWQQVTAAMAVLMAGGAYLPVAPELPPSRKAHLIGRPGVCAVLAMLGCLENTVIPPDAAMLDLDEALSQPPAMDHGLPLAGPHRATDLAYVLFTSGSTGEPKGVAISHRGAANTIQDMIRRFGLTPDDRVLALSAFNFDLSVYDIFGTLGTGATLVIPHSSGVPSPDEWARCVQEHAVTLWNSVPALLEMQLEYLGTGAAATLKSLRLVMLSGDWIPVSLPAKLAGAVPLAKLVSLGGATEASIWSNYFEVTHVDPSWTSIPYGWPLANQSLHVLDSRMQDAPPKVIGEIYIGGRGLAVGYYKDAARTCSSFVFHPDTGERLYRTGDMGRYDAQGCIEFLGRKDSQVKIRGFRIELGEIETQLERCPGVQSGALIVRKISGAEASLVAFYATKDEQPCTDSVLAHLKAHLPDYMVPSIACRVARIPTTVNGKVDRQALAQMGELLGDAPPASDAVAPGNDQELALADLWSSVLGRRVANVHHNFFELGGTSLGAVRLLNAIKARFHRDLPLASLFQHDTVAKQAVLVGQDTTVAATGRRDPKVVIQSRGTALLLMVHPVGGNVLCYRSFAELLPPGVKVLGLQSRADGSSRTVPEMATQYIEAAQTDIDQAGSVQLMGWSMGGVVAHEMVRQLEAMGVRVERLIMVDSWTGDPAATSAPSDALLRQGFMHDSNRGSLLNSQLRDEQGGTALPEALFDEYKANYLALVAHRPGSTTASTIHYRSALEQSFPSLTPFTSDGDLLAVKYLAEDHFSIMLGAAQRMISAEVLPVPSVPELAVPCASG